MTSPFPKLSLKPKAGVNSTAIKAAVITRKVATVISPTTKHRVEPDNPPKQVQRSIPDKTSIPTKRTPNPPKVKQIPPTPEELAENRTTPKAKHHRRIERDDDPLAVTLSRDRC